MASFAWTGGGGRYESGSRAGVPLRLRLRQWRGAAMRRTFEVWRETSEQPDGQARWDRAYQLVLGWAATPVTAAKEGAADASGVVRARVHRPPAARPDHRAASHPIADLCCSPRRVDGR